MGVSSLGKFIVPAGLAVIAGAANYVAPKATLATIISAFIYFAFWCVPAALAFLFIGIKTRAARLRSSTRRWCGRRRPGSSGITPLIILGSGCGG